MPLRDESFDAKQEERRQHTSIELLLRSVISANQLSYGGIADACDEVPKRIRAPEKPAALEHLEKVEIPTVFSQAENSTNAQ